MKIPKISLLQVIWILGQGIFLPLVLWLDDLRASGDVRAWGVFTLWEILCLADALLFAKIFRPNNPQNPPSAT